MIAYGRRASKGTPMAAAASVDDVPEPSYSGFPLRLQNYSLWTKEVFIVKWAMKWSWLGAHTVRSTILR